MKPQALPILFFLLLLTPVLSEAHEGHGDTKAKTMATNGGFKSETVSDKYEYIVKYAHTEAGEDAAFTLYINEFQSNRPVTADKLTLQLGGATVNAKATRPGIYTFSSPATAGAKNLQVSLQATKGADLVLLKGIDPTQEMPEAEVAVATTPTIPAWAWAIIGGLVGAMLLYAFMKLAGRRTKAALTLALLFVPLSQSLDVSAHEGHGDAAKKSSAGLANGNLVIAKESQFLFGLLTQPLAQGQFAPAIKAFGTVIPSPQGQADVISPQSGRLASLLVRVGERVKKGQLLASVEQVVDAQTQVQLESERNNLRAELTAAKAAYERLQSIADIAATRDVTEAKARYDRAVQNARLLERGVTASGRTIKLTSPIDGIVQGFSFASGANITAGQVVFTVTNLSEVFVEAQVFDKDLPDFGKAERFTITCADPARKHVSSDVKLVNIGQTLNATNQSQRVIFQVVNQEQDFKIGEFVDIRAFLTPEAGVITVPTSAITEVDGRPVVFIKDAPEEFAASFVQLGASNGSETVVLKGVEAGERVVTSAAFQAKMIYENR